MSRITYAEALGSLRSMFPDLEPTLIEDLLAANEGAMEPTIEQLLAVTATAEDGGGERGPATPPPQYGGPPPQASWGPPPGYAPQMLPVAVPLSGYPGYAPGQPAVMQLPVVSGGGGPGPVARGRPHTHTHRGRPVRHPLPADFLKLPPALTATPTAGRPRTTTTDEQMARDEALAATLQNEVFIAQVMDDPELANYILADPAGAASLGLPVHVLLPALQAAAARGTLPRGGHALPPAAGGSTSGSMSVTNSPASGSGPSPSGSGWISGMQHRLNTLAARFRRNQAAPAGTGTGGTGTGAPRAGGATPGRSWLPSFGSTRGYSGLATEDAGGGVSSDTHGSGYVPATRSDRVRVASQHPNASPGGVEIELTEAPAPAPQLTMPSGSGGGKARPGAPAPQADLSNAFAIDDDEDEGETTSLTRSKLV